MVTVHAFPLFSKAKHAESKYAVLVEASNAHMMWVVYDMEQDASVSLRWRSLPVTSRDVERRSSKEVLADLLAPKASHIFVVNGSGASPTKTTQSVAVFLMLPQCRRHAKAIEENIGFLFEGTSVTLYLLTHDVFRPSTELGSTPQHVAQTAVATSPFPPNCLLLLSIGEELLVSTSASNGFLNHPSVHTTSIAGKLRALHARTGALPWIHLNDIPQHLPVPFLADSTILALLTCVLREMALTLRTLVQEWATTSMASLAEEKRVVLLVGTEASLYKSLLGPNASDQVVEVHHDDVPWVWDSSGDYAKIPGVDCKLQVRVEEYIIDQAVGSVIRGTQLESRGVVYNTG